MSKSISREQNHFFSKVFTKQKSRGAPNSLAGSLTFGAHTNRVTIQATPRRSCAASTAFSFSMTATAGGFCPFTGSTRALSTRFRRNISSRDHNILSVAYAHQTHPLLLQICLAFPAQVVAHIEAG